MTEKQKDFEVGQVAAILPEIRDGLSEDASFLWRLEQREMHIWEAMFPAEERRGP